MKAVVLLIFVGFLGLCAREANAQQTDGALERDSALTGEFLLIADLITYDEGADTVVASGDVEASRGGRILRADRILYRRGDEVVTASGNVALLEPSGEVMFADSVELTGDLKSGVIHRLSVLLTDDARLVAGGAQRLDGNRTVMRRAVFSPCEICLDEPAREPFWQIKGGTVVHDQAERSLSYYDALLEVLGVPVLYTPYFRHPDPTVRRYSGFLVPNYRSSAALGAEVEIPYFWNIAPNRDATFSPRFTSDEGVVLAGEYRERTRDGRFTIDASVTRASTAAEDGRRIRGHLFGDGAFDIDENWRWGFVLERALDDTYLSRYDISSRDELVTTLFAEQYEQRSFVSGNGYLFQSLRAGEQSDRSPIVLPLLDANLVSAPDYAGGYATLDANLMVLERLDGVDSRRVSVTGGWHRPFISSGGHVFRIDASLRGDAYHVRMPAGHMPAELGQPLSGAKSTAVGRAAPQVALEWRYPMLVRIGSIRPLVEPIVQGVISPNGGNLDEIPDEDSRDVEFDHTNLFSTSRFTGLDRIEGGQRLNYGVRLGYYGRDGGRVTALFGQSARARDDMQFDPGTGLERRLSDYVGRIFVQPSPQLDLSLRFRLGRGDLTAKRKEIDLRAGPDWLRGRVGFADLARESGNMMEDFVGGREAVAGVATTFLDNWIFSTETRRDLKGHATIEWRSTLSYEDECILVGTGVRRSFTRDRDIQPETVLYFSVRLKFTG